MKTTNILGLILIATTLMGLSVPAHTGKVITPDWVNTTIPQQEPAQITHMGSGGGIPCFSCAQEFNRQYGIPLSVKWYNPQTQTVWIYDINGFNIDTHMPLV